jgi:hypothetical protein
MMFTRAEWYGSWPHWSEVNYDSTLKDVESAQYPEDSDKRFNERLAIIFYKYRDILDASYHLLLSESNDLEKLIQLAPGLLVIEPFTPVPDIVRLLNINEASFLDLLERNRHFLNFLKPKNHPFLSSWSTSISVNSWRTGVVPEVTTTIPYPIILQYVLTSTS